MTNEIRELQDGESPRTLNADGVTLAFFTAKWCGPCKAVKPKLPALLEQFPKLVIVLVDVDDCQECQEDFKITAMPTFVVLAKGKETFRAQGGGGLPGAVEAIEEAFKSC